LAMQLYNFVNDKRKSLALPSSVCLNSIEASTEFEIADLFGQILTNFCVIEQLKRQHILLVHMDFLGACLNFLP